MPSLMLYATSRHKLSWDFTVYQGETSVAEVDCAWLRERAVLTIGGKKYNVFRKAGAFVLASGEEVLARAEESGFSASSFDVVYGETAYQLKAKSSDEQVYQLAKGGPVIGTLTTKGILSRKIELQLPNDLPLVAQVFILWLVILSWKRASRAS